MIYCVIPRELEAELFDKMVEYYKDNPNVTVIVDRREGSDRRNEKDAADRPAVLAAVEEVGGLDHRQLLVGQTAQDRLRRDGRLGRRSAAAEDRAQVHSVAAPALDRHERRRRRALLEPAVLGSLVLTERADVDELRTLVRREPDYALAHEKGALADRACA